MRNTNKFYTDFVSISVDYKNGVFNLRVLDTENPNQPKLLSSIEHEGEPTAMFNINFDDKIINLNSKKEIKHSKKLKLSIKKDHRKFDA